MEKNCRLFLVGLVVLVLTGCAGSQAFVKNSDLPGIPAGQTLSGDPEEVIFSNKVVNSCPEGGAFDDAVCEINSVKRVPVYNPNTGETISALRVDTTFKDRTAHRILEGVVVGGTQAAIYGGFSYAASRATSRAMVKQGEAIRDGQKCPDGTFNCRGTIIQNGSSSFSGTEVGIGFENNSSIHNNGSSCGVVGACEW